jgi:hypothetical protein
MFSQYQLSGLIIASVLLLSACDNRERNLSRYNFVLGKQNFSLEMPARYRLTKLPTSGATTGVKFQVPNRRQIHYLSLEYGNVSALSSTQSVYTNRFTLKNGAILQYNVKRSDGGSGGNEAYLRGVLQYKTVTLAVVCYDQDEWAPAPAWCLNYLYYLK